MEKEFKKRIKYTGNVEYISMPICKDFNLGKFIENTLILVGYEDFNFIIKTNKKHYFVKIFASFRDLKNCERYVKIMTKAVEKNVSTPNLFKSDQGFLHIMKVNNTELRLCVMEYIKGKDFFQEKHRLNEKEIKFLAHQAGLINSINFKPNPVYDSWAIIHFLKEFREKSKFLSKKDLDLIKPLVNKFKDLKIESLPHCFVHGDIITTNVIKDSKGKLWVLDFSVSNYYPRIQELAILACNLFFDENSKEKSDKNLKIALEEYQKIIKLTYKELNSLNTYIELAHAMHLLSANEEKVNKNNKSEENEYWLSQGRKGLEQIKSY